MQAQSIADEPKDGLNDGGANAEHEDQQPDPGIGKLEKALKQWEKRWKSALGEIRCEMSEAEDGEDTAVHVQ